MRKLICICLLACGIFLLAGCGNSVPEGNAISVDKKGTITSTITESFDKDFYDADELKEEIDSELADYNKTFAKDHISLKKFEVKNGTAVLQMTFAGSDDYSSYNEEELFVGTVSEARAEGYDLSGELLDPNGAKTDFSSLEAGDEAKVLILETDDACQVLVPGEILAVSAGGNVTVTGKKQAAVESAGLSYIIYK